MFENRQVGSIVVAASIVAIAANVCYLRWPRQRPPVAARVQTLGRALSLPHRHPLGSAATVVLFVSSSCHFCAQSGTFYKRLTAARDPAKFAVIVAVPQGAETREDALEFLSAHGLTAEEELSVSYPDLGVRATPTVVLLDASGRNQGTWTGLLSGEKEAEVLSRLKILCPGCRTD
jgi:hypothetical protein